MTTRYFICIALFSVGGSTHLLHATNGVTYTYTGGRFGDNVISYIEARWIAFERGYEFYYRPFCYWDSEMNKHDLHLSEKLAMYNIHPHYRDHTKSKTVNIEDAQSIPDDADDTMFKIDSFPDNNPLDWDNMEFIKLLRKELAPITPFKKPSIPKDHLPIALHIRRGGGFDAPIFQTTALSHTTFPPEAYDIPEKKFLDKAWPKRVPPDSWYIDMLRYIAQKFPDTPIYVYIFTDDPRPDLFAEHYKKELNDERFTFDYRRTDNHHDQNVLEDFFGMMEFDVVIKASSWFSTMVCRLSRPYIEIEPVDNVWDGRKLIVTQVVEVVRKDTENRCHTKHAYQDIEKLWLSVHTNAVKHYKPPKDVRKKLAQLTPKLSQILEDCKGIDCHKKYAPLAWQFDSLPGYYVKWNIDRITGKERLDTCIEKNRLNQLVTPKKYLYHVPGRPKELSNDNYLVIAQEIKRNPQPLEIDLLGAQQIATLINKTGFLDFRKDNIIRTTDNRIAIVDTEKSLFNDYWGTCYGVERILSLGRFDLNTEFTQEALRSLMSTIKQCKPITCESYQDIIEVLRKQPTPHSWDYLTFFKELYPEYSS